MLDGDDYILINLYKANTETEKCKIFNELQSLLINLTSIKIKELYLQVISIFYLVQN